MLIEQPMIVSSRRWVDHVPVAVVGALAIRIEPIEASPHR
jgi:hypothetical protein